MKYLVLFAAALGVASASTGLLAGYADSAIDGLNEMVDSTAARFSAGAGALTAPGGIFESILGSNGILGRLCKEVFGKTVKNFIPLASFVSGYYNLACIVEQILFKLEAIIHSLDALIANFIGEAVQAAVSYIDNLAVNIGDTVNSYHISLLNGVGDAVKKLDLTPLIDIGRSVNGILSPIADLIHTLAIDIGGPRCPATPQAIS